MKGGGIVSQGRPRKPIALHLAEGNPSHLTKKEIEEYTNSELHVPFVDIKPPEYLTGEKQIAKFNYYAKMLLELGIFTELDVDCLAQYIMGEQLYLQYTNLLVKLIKSKDYDQLSKIQGLQDRAFRQCRQCASDLGLSVSKRCKLVVPQPLDDEDDEL
jgi:P27 family predicted phage terminase small subunit